MTVVFHARLYGRFIEIEINFRRKKLHKTNQRPNFLGDSFNNRDNVRAPIQFRKDDLSSRTNSSIFASVAPVLLDRSNKTSSVFPLLKPTNHLNFLSSRSHSISDASSNCCHRSNV